MEHWVTTLGLWIETPRTVVAQDGAGTTTKATVYRTTVYARQALAEAVAEEPGIRFGPTVDRLMRFKSVAPLWGFVHRTAGMGCLAGTSSGKKH